MGLGDAAWGLVQPTSDALSETLLRLPFSEPEPTPGEEWARLREVLRLDEAPGKLLVSTIRDKKFGATVADPSWDQIADLTLRGNCVYFGLSTVPADWRPSKATGFRGREDTCLPRSFIGVDFDLNFGVHKRTESGAGIGLETAVAAIAAFPARPVAVVFSGGGLHAYYRLAGRADATALRWVGDRVNGWFLRVTNPPRVEDWDSAPTIDLARILRVPGTLNRKAGGDGVWVRLMHTDAEAAPITREMAASWPTFAEVKKAREPRRAVQPLRSVPRLPRQHDGVPPWEALTAAFADDDAFAALLERLGAEVSGTSVCMPGDPAWEEPNSEFHGSIWTGESGVPVVTIHGSGTRCYWADGSDRATFDAFDLLVRVFSGDRRAAARYVNAHVVSDPEAWLETFTWKPGDPAPGAKTRGRGTEPAAAGAPRAVEKVTATKKSTPAVVAATPVPPRPLTDRDAFTARPHCATCCPGTAYKHTGDHVEQAECDHTVHCASHCRIEDCATTHGAAVDCWGCDDF